MSEAAVSHYLTEFDRFKNSRLPDWLPKQRADALEYLQSNGFPTRKREKWKYTDVSPITRRKFTLGPAAPEAMDEGFIDTLRFSGLDCHDLVFINGGFSERLSRAGNLPDEVTARSLASMKSENPALPERFLTGPGEEIDHAFTALNIAFLNDGALIHIPDGTQVLAPIHVIYATDKNTESIMSHPRNLIVLGRQARATIIETYAGREDTEYFTNSRTQILCQDSAQLDYYKIQQESHRAFHIDNTKIRQQRNSRIDCHSLSLGGSLARSDIDVELDEPGAEINLNGLYLANGRQHIDNHTLIEHKQPHTVSNEHYRGVMGGRARAVFNGKVIVHEQAQKTQAHQSNANLLLSGNAEVDTKPELEIYADDVKCSHGATVGRLDENMLFYLRARALDKDTAKSLLIYAFADEVIRNIKLPELRNRLEYNVVGELPDTDLIKGFMK